MAIGDLEATICTLLELFVLSEQVTLCSFRRALTMLRVFSLSSDSNNLALNFKYYDTASINTSDEAFQNRIQSATTSLVPIGTSPTVLLLPLSVRGIKQRQG
jgi:hypothetical protein